MKVEIKDSSAELLNELSKVLDENNGKISKEFIDLKADTGSKSFTLCDNTTILCIIKLKNGAKVWGISQVLKEENFNREIGETVAFNNAKDKLWDYFGGLAKLLR